jgi:outer membrane immunogenic protein
MKKLIIAGAVLVACMAGPAIAAELPVEPPVYVERPAAIGLWNWTGFYVGANLGYARGYASKDIEVTQVPLFALTESANGVIGGGRPAQAGKPAMACSESKETSRASANRVRAR